MRAPSVTSEMMKSSSCAPGLEAIEVTDPTTAAHAGNNARLAAWLHGSAVPKTFSILVAGTAKTVVVNVSHRPA